MRLPYAALGQELDRPIEMELEHTCPEAVGRLLEEVARNRDSESLAFADGWQPYSTKRPHPGVRQTEEDTGMPELLRVPAQQTETGNTMKEGT
jgi:hypothetical protein